jgi:predicted phosphodiesterase
LATTLVIPDTHAPFMHPDAIPFLDETAQRANPDAVVHIGDVADFHFSSFYSKSSQNSGDQELDKASEQLDGLAALFPDVEVCWGNHDERLIRKLESSGLPKRVLRSMNSILGLPDKGWRWGESCQIEGVTYEHGQQYSGRDAHIKATVNNLGSTVIGHVHAHAGVHYVANRRSMVWGMNVGCLIDPRAYAFEYAKRGCRPVLGCGLVIDGTPMFVPMKTTPAGRWVRG